MSIHSDRAYNKARRKGAIAASSYHQWRQLMDLSKRELAEIAMHLAGMCTDSYDEACGNDNAAGAFRRLMEERVNLRDQGIL